MFLAKTQPIPTNAYAKIKRMVKTIIGPTMSMNTN